MFFWKRATKMIWHPYEQNSILKNIQTWVVTEWFCQKFEKLTQKLVFKSSWKVDKPPKETLHKFISSINPGCNCTREKPNISPLVLALNNRNEESNCLIYCNCYLCRYSSLRKTNVDYGKLCVTNMRRRFIASIEKQSCQLSRWAHGDSGNASSWTKQMFPAHMWEDIIYMIYNI